MLPERRVRSRSAQELFDAARLQRSYIPRNPVMHFPSHVFAPIIPIAQSHGVRVRERARVGGGIMFPERRSCLRHKVHGPVFASFDGVTGGMILDLSEQGLSMQTMVPLEADRQTDRRIQLRFDLPQTDTHLETTGYIAWADALGRAGVRFSELPAEARQRLDEWLSLNDQAPSRKAPKLDFDRVLGPNPGARSPGNGTPNPRSLSLEAEPGASEFPAQHPVSSTIQYEFHSLGSDLNTALRVISDRARSLLRGAGAAIAL